jgi:hypothetical protein
LATRRRRVIAIVLIVVAFIIDAYGLATSSAPIVRVPFLYENLNTKYWNQTLGYPLVHLNIIFVLTAHGSFSVNNSVHIDAILENVTIPNLTQYYDALGFTNEAPNTTEVPAELRGAQVPIKSIGEGRYEANGDVVWVGEGATWPFLWPRINKYVLPLWSDLESGGPLLDISGVSDTLSGQNNVIIQKLTWIFVGFSVLSVYPILEALLVIEPSSKPLTQARHKKD